MLIDHILKYKTVARKGKRYPPDNSISKVREEVDPQIYLLRSYFLKAKQKNKLKNIQTKM